MLTIRERVRYKPPLDAHGHCPHCGGPAPTQNYVTLNTKKSVAYCGDKAIRLTKQPMIVFAMIVRAFPDPVPRERIMDKLCEEGDPNDDKVVDVCLTKIRKAIFGTAASIENSWGNGWFLEVTQGD